MVAPSIWTRVSASLLLPSQPSPLSPIIADIVMQDLEKRALEGFINEIPFYY